MDASYFYLLVLPLGIFVFLLAVSTQYYARKEERARRKLSKLMNAHAVNQPEPKNSSADERTPDDYRIWKLEKALEQPGVATIWTGLGEKEKDKSTEPQCSEEDDSYNVT